MSECQRKIMLVVAFITGIIMAAVTSFRGRK